MPGVGVGVGVGVAVGVGFGVGVGVVCVGAFGVGLGVGLSVGPGVRGGSVVVGAGGCVGGGCVAAGTPLVPGVEAAVGEPVGEAGGDDDALGTADALESARSAPSKIPSGKPRA
jgi:hypothetical protein